MLTGFNIKQYLFFIGAYSLSIRDWEPQKGDHVKHYKIKAMDNGGFYVTTRKTFVTLQELVSYYSGIHFYCIFQLIYMFYIH